jgi:hypothetical protein
MGDWATAIVVVASLAGVFFAVMGFRGLIDALDSSTGRCARCGRAGLLPLPTRSHECRRCHRRPSIAQFFSSRTQLRH